MSRLNLRNGTVAFVSLAVVLIVAPRVRAEADPDLNIPQLLTGFSAKEACSCAFVTEQTDDYCKEFGAQPGFSAEITIDRGAKSVSVSFLSANRSARFVEGIGCTLSD